MDRSLPAPGAMDVTIRDETDADHEAIAVLTAAAFADVPYSSHTEHFIVDALRQAGALSVSLVAQREGVIVGHVALSPVSVSEGSTGWFGLGPVSVSPAVQGRGIGTALVSEALDRIESRGAAGCVVLGEPAFYGRLGFRSDTALSLPGVPAGYFQARSFSGPPPTGSVTYHEAFSIVE